MHPQVRTSYDTSVKHLYRLGCEAIIPRALRAEIPRANIHRWKHEPDGKYQGCELQSIAGDKLQLLRQFANHQSAQRAFRAFVRLPFIVQRTVLAVKGVREALRKSADTIVAQAEQARQVVGIKPVLRLLEISRGTCDDWKARTVHKCAGSHLGLCLRRHPWQLTGGEVDKLKSLLLSPDHLHWPISSLAAWARRWNVLPLSDNTWYKYARFL